ncbi:MAG: secondary thiamine-phosphate synthase enzyme YjbQ [Actinomycetota bacterium]|nr:secondary thiamine-phosphate synthase enzyme YjbQ [Actinomycetota bacterium]
MTTHTAYRTFNTAQRRQFVRITEDVAEAVAESGIREGMVLVSAMHITAGVWVNDDEPGILEDVQEWLDKLAPPSWKAPANDVAEALSPDPGYRHHRGGEDNGDAHLKNLLVHHQVIVPVTDGRLDLGPWQAIFYAEFDGGRDKRLIIKAMGE